MKESFPRPSQLGTGKSSNVLPIILTFFAFGIAGSLYSLIPSQQPTAPPTKQKLQSAQSQTTNADPQSLLAMTQDKDGYRYIGGSWQQIQEHYPATRSKQSAFQKISPIAWAALMVAYITLIFAIYSFHQGNNLTPSTNQA